MRTRRPRPSRVTRARAGLPGVTDYSTSVARCASAALTHYVLRTSFNGTSRLVVTLWLPIYHKELLLIITSLALWSTIYEYSPITRIITDLIPIWWRLLHGFGILLLYSMAIDCIIIFISHNIAASVITHNIIKKKKRYVLNESVCWH